KIALVRPECPEADIRLAVTEAGPAFGDNEIQPERIALAAQLNDVLAEQARQPGAKRDAHRHRAMHLAIPAFDPARRRLHVLQLIKERLSVLGQLIAGLASVKERTPQFLFQFEDA